MGARAFDFDLESGTAVFAPPRGEPVHPRDVEAAVRGAGFELLGFELEVRGRVTRGGWPDEDGEGGAGDEALPVLEVPATGQRFLLLEGGSERGRAAWARLAPRLERPGSTLRVRGVVHAPGEEPYGLLVADVGPLREGGASTLENGFP